MKKQFGFKKIIAFFCSLLFLILSLSQISVQAIEAFPDTSGANMIYLYNFESGQVIYSKGSGTSKIAPASTVKIMSGLLAIRHLEGRLDEDVTLTENMLRGVEGFNLNLKVGDTLKINDLLYGLICGGGNDAAIALANICSGSTEGFVEEMNALATEFGMQNTFYTNPTGIDNTEMYTSLNDTVILSQKAIENSLFIKISGTPSYIYEKNGTSESKTIANRNALISTFSAIGYQNKRVEGLNAGMTDRGGYCVSAYATDGQDSYLCIVMGGKETANGKIASYSIVNSLLGHMFNNYTYTQIAQKGDKIGELEVELALPTGGKENVYVNCLLENDIFAFAPKNIDYKKDLTYKVYYHTAPLTAPVFENNVVGGVDIFYEDEYLASARLLTDEYISASRLLTVLEQMKRIILSRPTLFFILILIPSLLLYFYFTLWRKKFKRRKRIQNEIRKSRQLKK